MLMRIGCIHYAEKLQQAVTLVAFKDTFDKGRDAYYTISAYFLVPMFSILLISCNMNIIL